MARSQSAVLKGGTSKAVKAATKLKELKADLKVALKDLKAADKAAVEAVKVVAKLEGKISKLEAPTSVEVVVVEEAPVLLAESDVPPVVEAGYGTQS